MCTTSLSTDQVTDIRNAVNAGLVLGNNRVRKEAELLTGQRPHHQKRGPKPKTKSTDEFLL